jgi:hypothetical protein
VTYRDEEIRFLISVGMTEYRLKNDSVFALSYCSCYLLVTHIFASNEFLNECYKRVCMCVRARVCACVCVRARACLYYIAERTYRYRYRLSPIFHEYRMDIVSFSKLRYRPSSSLRRGLQPTAPRSLREARLAQRRTLIFASKSLYFKTYKIIYTKIIY